LAGIEYGYICLADRIGGRINPTAYNNLFTQIAEKLPSFSAIRWVFSEVGLTMFCLKYRPNLPATRFADVPDQPEMVNVCHAPMSP